MKTTRTNRAEQAALAAKGEELFQAWMAALESGTKVEEIAAREAYHAFLDG